MTKRMPNPDFTKAKILISSTPDYSKQGLGNSNLTRLDFIRNNQKKVTARTETLLYNLNSDCIKYSPHETKP